MTTGTTPAEQIGHAVVSARKSYGLTQQQAADMAGISDRTLREIEKGTGSPRLASVLAITDVLGLQLGISS